MASSPSAASSPSPSSSASTVLQAAAEIPGEKLTENFELIEKIADGVAATVYKGRHKLLEDLVAIKILKQNLINQDSALERFRREAKLASQLDHPNIVRIKGFGISTEGRAFIVMQYCPGLTLEKRLQQSPLPKVLALRILQQVALALAAAHSAGIIHRDIKPANIILEKLADEAAPNPYEVKLLDFGVAKAFDETGSGNGAAPLTQVNEVLGTPAYMSPEQCRSQTADNRSDIYSLGCVLFECCTGRKPFVADSDLAIMDKHLHVEPEFNNADHVGATLKQVILTCMAKDPAKRYQSAAELSKALVYCQKLYGRKNSSVQSLTPVLMIVVLMAIPLFAFYRLQQSGKRGTLSSYNLRNPLDSREAHDIAASRLAPRNLDDLAASRVVLREPHVIADSLRTGHASESAETLLTRAVSLSSGKSPKQENIERAELYFELASEHAFKEKNKDLAGRSLFELGKMHYFTKQYEKATKAFRKCKDLALDASNPPLESEALRYLALISFVQQNDIPTALKYRQQALALSPGYSRRTSQIRREIADCYYCMGQALKAQEFVMQNIAGRMRQEPGNNSAGIENASDNALLCKFALALKHSSSARKCADVLLTLAQEDSKDHRYAAQVLNTAEEFYKAKDYTWSLKLAHALREFKQERISAEEMAAAQRLIVACNANLKNTVAK